MPGAELPTASPTSSGLGLALNLPDGHPDIGRSAQHLGSLLHKLERYGEAEALYLEALENWRRSLGPTHPFTLGTVRSLVALYSDWGRKADAARYAGLLQDVH